MRSFRELHWKTVLLLRKQHLRINQTEMVEFNLDELSPRERQILGNASKGLTDKEIAVRLGISITTVRTYWERLYQKTEAVNRASAVALYVQGRTDEIPPIPEKPLEPSTLLQAAVDMTLGGVIVLGEEARTIEASNEKACSLVNCVAGTMEGKPLEEIVPRRYKAFYSGLAAALEADSETALTVSTFVRVLGGHDLLCSITIRTLDAPEGRHIVLFVQDAVSEINARRRGHATRG